MNNNKFGKEFVITDENALYYAAKIGIWVRERIMMAGGRDGVVLGLSGGVDSAVVAALCVYAGVPIYGVALPYGDGMDKSGTMARVDELVAKFPEIVFGGAIDIAPNLLGH